jgi:hypothetical protein
VRDGDALVAVERFERRWTGKVRESEVARRLRDGIASILVGDISLIALVVLTVGLTIVVGVDVPHLFS